MSSDINDGGSRTRIATVRDRVAGTVSICLNAITLGGGENVGI